MNAHSAATRARFGAARQYLAFLPLCFGVFIAADDLTVVATVLPEVLLSLEVPATNIDQAAWLVVAFLIGYTATMPVMGRLSDRWGYRRAFAIALAIFAIGSALVAISPSTDEWLERLPGTDLGAYNFMIAARVVQALGAGAVIPIALASAGLVVGTRHQVVAYGMVGASAEAGGVIGPLWGGTIDSLLSWEYAFWINLPLALIAALMLIPMPAGRSNPVAVDWFGGATFAVALTTAAMAAFRIPNPNLLMALLATTSVVAIAMLILQIRHPGSIANTLRRTARRATLAEPDPQATDAAHIPRYLFALASFVGANIGHLLVGAALMIGMVSVPLAAGIVYELDAFQSGLWLLRMTLALGICALLGGMIAQRFGSRIPAIAGMALTTIGYLIFAAWNLDVAEPTITISLVLIGAGFGLVIAPIADRALHGVSETDRGLAAGIVTLTRNVGMAMGLAVLTPIGTEQILTMAPGIAELIAEPTASAEVGLDVFNAFALYAAIACAIAIIPLWVMTRPSPSLAKEDSATPENAPPNKRAENRHAETAARAPILATATDPRRQTPTATEQSPDRLSQPHSQTTMSAHDPSSFQTSVRKPDDFDEYWAQTLADAEAVPLNASFSPDEMRSDEHVEVFHVEYDSYADLRIAGWYARPRKHDGNLPGYLFVPGYVSEPKMPTDLAYEGYAAFSAAPRNKLRSNDVFNPGYPGLLTHNIDKRTRYGYRGFYMDAIRAYDLLAGLDEVDATRIGVQGGSQGGALTLLVSALRPDGIAAASAGAPYLCSMMDAATLTRSYPYEEINDYLRLFPERENAVRETLDLHDIHNFVDRITCPIIVNIGLMDDVCPPETGFEVFRAIGSSDKTLYQYENCAHDAGTGIGHDAIMREFMTGILKPKPIEDFQSQAVADY